MMITWIITHDGHALARGSRATTGEAIDAYADAIATANELERSLLALSRERRAILLANGGDEGRP